jgi:hypothetical protein
MKRLSVFAVALSFFAAACTSSGTTAPSATKAVYTATLSPANEVPPIGNAESVGTGTVTATFDETFVAGNVTAATVTFAVTLSGFPPNTPINAAHIHPGVAGVNGTVLVSAQVIPGEVVLTNGSGSFTKGPFTLDAAQAQTIINNPANFYFNVHSSINPGGVARGQLVRVP